MRFWLASFLMIFALAELYEWVKDVTLPLPIYIFGGALLAIASNYEKGLGSSAEEKSPPSEPEQIQTNPPVEEISPQTPVNPTPQPIKSISFKINKNK